MNRTEHRVRMCFDPEYSRSYNFFLSRKKVLIKVYSDDLKSETILLICGLLISISGSFLGFFISNVFLSVPFDLSTGLEIFTMTFSVCLCMSFVRTLFTIITCILGIRSLYKIFILESGTG